MAVAVHPDTELSALARRAEQLDARAERKRQEARELASRAADLRVQISSLTRRPVEVLARPAGQDTWLQAKVAEVLDRMGPCQSPFIAEHLNVSNERALAVLRVLEEGGAVKRSGIRRGTIWGLATDEDLVGHGASATASTLVRDMARKLDTFDADLIDEALPMLTRNAILRELRELVAEGMLETERDGRSKLYALVKPKGGPTERPKHKPPELRIVEQARRTSGPIAGTGRQHRSGSPLVDELIREVRPFGVEIKRSKHQIQYLLGGTVVASSSKTPGASSLADTRRDLIAAGVPVRER